MANARFSTKALTGHLKKLAGEVVDMLPDGTPVTREEKLAQLIWDQALGYTQEVRNEEGTLEKVVHKPVAWAQQYLFERVEGKAQVMQPDNESGMKAADKVRDLAKQRVNALAAASAGGPPKHKPAKPKPE